MTEKVSRWSRPRLKQMLWHNYFGTLADNVIEIGWVLCFSLIADKAAIERITTMFGLNDAFWVILSATYYTARTAMVSRLPRLVAEEGVTAQSKQFKTAVYMSYLMLFPAAIGSLLYMPRLLELLGVAHSDIPFYLPYFQLSVLCLLLAAPWSILVPSYLRARGRSETATKLDHAVAWGMIGGIFVTTHAFKQGVLWALAVNLVTNAIPLFCTSCVGHYWGVHDDQLQPPYSGRQVLDR